MAHSEEKNKSTETVPEQREVYFYSIYVKNKTCVEKQYFNR